MDWNLIGAVAVVVVVIVLAVVGVRHGWFGKAEKDVVADAKAVASRLDPALGAIPAAASVEVDAAVGRVEQAVQSELRAYESSLRAKVAKGSG